ncbi:MAG: methyltransferase domain-containing protein [Spirochaetales bacterium]|nr:methyltransferase domain-containing protein [Spirochaetales bacterium]
MMDWNPEHYLQFRSERTQPSIDLISRIEFDNPSLILDIGCGPGNSTRVLAERWPQSHVIGLDNSETMIEKAKNDYPEMEWILAEAATYEPERKADILFSNAAIQWMDHHDTLLQKFYHLLSDNGLLAVQVPLFRDMPLGKCIDRIARDTRWKYQLEDVSTLLTIHNYSFYYDILSSLFNSTEVWETHYMHVLDSHLSILEMIRSTGLKPYLSRLADDIPKKKFEQEVLKSIEEDYPIQKNGKVIFPFHRLFFIARK